MHFVSTHRPDPVVVGLEADHQGHITSGFLTRPSGGVGAGGRAGMQPNQATKHPIILPSIFNGSSWAHTHPQQHLQHPSWSVHNSHQNAKRKMIGNRQEAYFVVTHQARRPCGSRIMTHSGCVSSSSSDEDSSFLASGGARASEGGDKACATTGRTRVGMLCQHIHRA